MHTDKQMNVSYQASLDNRHIRRFTGDTVVWTVKRRNITDQNVSYALRTFIYMHYERNVQNIRVLFVPDEA